jgi:hypothetical protein
LKLTFRSDIYCFNTSNSNGSSSTGATTSNISSESKSAATINRINERIKAKFAKNKEKRKEIKSKSEYLSFSPGETKILLIDLSDPRTGDNKPCNFNNGDDDDEEKTQFRYIFNDISPGSNDTAKKWIWDVGRMLV